MKTKNQKQANRVGPKRAGILIRVSSAEQAVKKNKKTGEEETKISPEKQEEDCRERCRERNYVVAEVYKDIERYRDATGRLVEPSGTRSDRPGLTQALADIDAGKIDVLVAWRQDRISRGITRALLDLKERIDAGKVVIELAKETFDPSTFEILAWAAGVELRGKRDRLMMGVAGRLANGKAWNHPPLYGLTKEDGIYSVNPDEAKWVAAIWEWYAAGVGVGQIQRRLVEARARQRKGNKAGEHQWALVAIYKILRTDAYFTGRLKMEWGGEVYELACPVLVDAKTAQRARVRHERALANPVHHVHVEFLAAGLTYCGVCGGRMQLYNWRSGPYNQLHSQYRCNRYHQGTHLPDCPKLQGARKVDGEVWERVWAFMTKKKGFAQAVEARIKQLQAEERAAAADVGKLEAELVRLEEERRRTVTAHRKGVIGDADLEIQLAEVQAEQDDVRRELDAARPLLGHQSERLMEVARVYREHVAAGFEALNATPATPEQAQLQFAARRQLVQGLVKKVRVGKDHEIGIDLVLGLPVDPPALGNGSQLTLCSPRTTTS